MREHKARGRGSNGGGGEGGGGGDSLRLRLAREHRAVLRKAKKQGPAEAAEDHKQLAEGKEPAKDEAHEGDKAAADQVVALPDGLKHKMEQQLGADFSGVKIHIGAQAENLAESMGAQAFTQGADVYFGKDEWKPGSRETEELLAHELVHVVQQGAAPPKADKEGDKHEGHDDKADAHGGAHAPKEAPPSSAPQAKLTVSQPGDAAEVEADRLAAHVVAGGAGRPQAPPSAGVHRAAKDPAKAPAADAKKDDKAHPAGDKAAAAPPKALPAPAPEAGKEPKAGDSGILTAESTAKIGDKEEKLPMGTVVQVVSVAADKLKVKVYSGKGGAEVEVNRAIFERQPGVAINEATEKPRGDVYASFQNASLWGEGGPKPDDVRQGHIGDCYLMAAMGAVCAANPGAIKKMFSPQKSGEKVYSVTLFKEEKGKLTPQTIAVDTMMPAANQASPEPGEKNAAGASQLAYAGMGKTEATASLWPALLEKAYAQLVGGYAEAGKGGASSDAMSALTGEKATYESKPPKDQVIERFKKYKDEGKAVVCGTLGSMEHKAEKAFKGDKGQYNATLKSKEGEPCSLLKNTLAVTDTKSKNKSETNDFDGKMVGPSVESGSVEHATGKVDMKFKADKAPDTADNLVAEYDYRGKISKDLNLYAHHAYIFEKLDGDKLVFKNPWGFLHPNPVSAELFEQFFTGITSDVVPKPEEPPPGGK